MLRERKWAVDETLDGGHMLTAKFPLIFNKDNVVVIEMPTPGVVRRCRMRIDRRLRSSRASCGITPTGL
jgi:hypothetical protein